MDFSGSGQPSPYLKRGIHKGKIEANRFILHTPPLLPLSRCSPTRSLSLSRFTLRANKFHHIHRSNNEAADTLANIGSLRQEIPPGVALEKLYKPSITPCPGSDSIRMPQGAEPDGPAAHKPEAVEVLVIVMSRGFPQIRFCLFFFFASSWHQHHRIACFCPQKLFLLNPILFF